ncbi:tRNA (adenosine(37)-N6)-threonylcarbamoyltransferase complex transferase subunit TsaD [Gemmatimonadota bacterium]
MLGIETSCDETAAAVVQGWRKILGNVVVSQEIHAEWGGVVPELASREHLKLTLPSIRQAMSTAGVTWKDLDGIAVTRGPGLIGALLVGLSVAKALSLGTGLPLIGVNHLEGHLFSLLLEDPEWRPPYLVLIASGGHTEIHMVEDLGVYHRLGSTVDDAAGEAFDKVGVLLGLDYPAGSHLDALAESAEPGALRFPVARVDGPGHNFSFSGLKTAVMTHWRGIPEDEREAQRGTVARIPMYFMFAVTLTALITFAYNNLMAGKLFIGFLSILLFTLAVVLAILAFKALRNGPSTAQEQEQE